MERKRKNSLRSCEECRAHHTACNGEEPCARCVRMRLQCEFTARKKRGRKTDAERAMRREEHLSRF